MLLKTHLRNYKIPRITPNHTTQTQTQSRDLDEKLVASTHSFVKYPSSVDTTDTPFNTTECKLCL